MKRESLRNAMALIGHHSTWIRFQCIGFVSFFFSFKLFIPKEIVQKRQSDSAQRN